VIPREGVESVNVSLNPTVFKILTVIPREGVESRIPPANAAESGDGSTVIPREGVESIAAE